MCNCTIQNCTFFVQALIFFYMDDPIWYYTYNFFFLTKIYFQVLTFFII